MSSVRARLQLRAGELALTAALAVAGLLAYVLVHRGVVLALLALIAPALVLWLVRRPGNGYLLAVALLFTVPDWYPHVWLMAPAFVLIGCLAGVARTRLRLLDLVVLGLVIIMAQSWLFHTQEGVSTKAFVEGVLPFGFYLYSRLAVTERILRRLCWVLLAAATVGALTVLFDAARGVAQFQPPAQYIWRATATTIFRASGIFGGAPAAASCLAMAFLTSFALFRRERGRAMIAFLTILAAIIVTFDRAGLLAVTVGTMLFAVLLPYRRWGRVALAALAIGIIVYAVTSSSSAIGTVSSSKIVAEGVIRQSTLKARLRLLPIATELLHAPASELAFGRGFDALEGPPGSISVQLAGSPMLLELGGPNDQYLTSLIEQGAAGLVLLVMWLGGSVTLGVRAALRLPRGSERRALVAGLTAAVAGFMLVMSGHDVLHNLPMTSVAALTSGILVSVCSLPSAAGGVAAAEA